MNTKSLIVTILAFTLLNTAAEAQTVVSGAVFLDRNNNGICEKGERGLSDIPVSNGDTIVMTDRQGRFSLPVSDTLPTPVFPVLPPEYRLSAQGKPNGTVVRGAAEIKFGAIGQKASKRFRTAFIGDVHVEDSTMFCYFRRTIIDRLLTEQGVDQNIWLGDLVNESPRWLRPLAETMQVLPAPSYCIMGNHDFDDRRGRGKERYIESFGADTYAFRRGGVCFVMLNNSRGDYRDSDLRFVGNLSQCLPKECLMVLCQHIPLQYVGRGDRMQKVLEQCPQRTLIMSAHQHVVMRKHYGPKLTDQTVGSVCSVWWRGTKNEDWLPHSLQQCGSPRNFFTVDFNGADYTIAYHPIDGQRQMHVWVEGDDPGDRNIEGLNAFARGSVVVNVFGGDDTTTVSMSIDDGAEVSMVHTAVADPYVARLANLSRSYERKDPRRAPYLRAASPHVWTAVLPENLNGIHTLTFRAEGPCGLSAQESIVISR